MQDTIDTTERLLQPISDGRMMATVNSSLPLRPPPSIRQQQHIPQNRIPRPSQRKCKVRISVDDIDVSTRWDEIQVAQGKTIRDLRRSWLGTIEEEGYFTLSHSSLPLDDDYQIRDDLSLNCRNAY